MVPVTTGAGVTLPFTVNSGPLDGGAGGGGGDGGGAGGGGGGAGGGLMAVTWT
jgi:hypothetical protein